MRDYIRHRLLLFIPFLFCLVGCEEHININNEVVPSLIPRSLNVSEVRITAPSSEAYTTKLSVTSINSSWLFEGIPSWISMKPNHGVSSANVSVSFTANLSADTSRYALLFFKDEMEDWDYQQVITANQPEAVPYLKLSTDSLHASGATYEYKVDILSNASWEVKESCAWASTEILGSSLHISVQANNTGEYRETDLYVYAASCMDLVHITQAPASAVVEEKALTFSNQATTAKLSITSESVWQATTSASWLQITPENGPAGTTEITIDVAPNTNIAERRGYITFSCNTSAELLTIEIFQEGLYIERDKSILSFGSKEGSMELQINSNVAWEVTSIPQWATASVRDGNGDASISISVEDNPSIYQRTGTLKIESPGLDLSTTVLLKQEGKTFNIGTTLLEFSDKSSTNTVDITTDGTWEAHCDAEWLTMSPHSASGNSSLAISVTENTGHSDRMATVSVTMSDKTIELAVHQQGKYLSVDNNQIVFPTKGGAKNLHIATNDIWKAMLKENADWLKLSESEGEGLIDITLSATDNASVNERSDILNIATKHGLNVDLPIKQEARRLSVSASDVLFFYRGGTSEVITIQTNGEYRISQVGDWFSVSRTGNSFTVNASRNETKENREGSITITMTDLTEGNYAVTIPVAQTREGCSFTLSGFGSDDNQDATLGEGNFTGNGFESDDNQDATLGEGNITGNGFGADFDWSTSVGKAFTVNLVDFVTDSNWNAINNNTFTVTIIGYRDENDWNNNDSLDTSLDKENFSNDTNQDNNDLVDSPLSKENFVDDENWNN